MISIAALLLLSTQAPAQTVLLGDPLNWGNQFFVKISNEKFPQAGGNFSVKNDDLLLNGKKVWLWSISSRRPTTRVKTIEISVSASGGKEKHISVPSQMLKGLVDLSYDPKSGKAGTPFWIDQSGQNFQFRLDFGDGAHAFSAIFMGNTKRRSIERQVFLGLEGKVLDKITAKY